MYPILNPFSLEMVLHDDWAQHAFGWLYFRNQSPFVLPFGTLRNFLHPLGSNVAYMDSLPWVALVMRFFSDLLPRDFQYLGVWILGCSAALGFSAAWMVRGISPRWEHQALVGVLAAMSPSLMTRIVHPALCAHVFIVLAVAISLVQAASNSAGWRAIVAAIGLVWLSAATHPYLCMMVLSIVIGLPMRLRPQLGWKVLTAPVAMLAGTILLFYAFGYLDNSMNYITGGFGTFSANLNTLYNSMGHSRLFGGIPTSWGQYEGYGYLGAGVLLLGIVASSLLVPASTRRLIRDLPWRRARWALPGILACSFYSLATPVLWNQTEVLRIDWYGSVDKWVQSFRSTGRYIWPLQYAIVLLVAVVVLHALRRRPHFLTAVLASCVAVQAYDIDTAEAWNRLKTEPRRPFTAPQWNLADRAYDHLVLFPTQVKDLCEKRYDSQPVNELAYLAYSHRWTFNSGYSARQRFGTRDYCDSLKKTVHAGQFSPRTLYVVLKRKEALRVKRRGALCGKLDGLFVCVDPNEGPLAQFLRDNPF
jgi:hypothetical protein